jgi:undecaprenyl diphosphate synthase
MSEPPRTPTPEPFDVPIDKRPRHIAVIMDGNGRWAQRRGLPRVEGHRRGAESVRRVTEECVRLSIPYLTLYCLSSENWKRPKEELDALLLLLQQYMIEQRGEVLQRGIRVSMIGRRVGLPQDVLAEVDKTVAMSRENAGLHVCLAVNYGSRGELVDAVAQIARQLKEGRLDADALTEETIAANLYTSGVPDPDLLIRTGGEMRVSNFLLWQISYAEIWVTPALWPEFDEEQLRQAIRDYAARRRRFGGL